MMPSQAVAVNRKRH
jgi:hypothetical protein